MAKSLAPTSTARFPVAESSQVGEIRRHVGRLAADLGFTETDRGHASTIAVELANNLARHAKQGELVVQFFSAEQDYQLDIHAIDAGPGMADPARCLEDGYSTIGTPGTGLGAIRRLSTEFDLFSMPERGTVIFSRVASKRAASPPGQFIWAGVSKPAPYETLCGDAWRVSSDQSSLAVLVVDGLGHGPLAADAAAAAASVFNDNPFNSPMNLFTTADHKLRSLRGAAMAVAHLHADQRMLQYAGVGNIAGTLRKNGDPKGRGLVSHNGTVGAAMRKVQVFDYNLAGTNLLIMASDGLQTRWNLDEFPGLARRHPGVVAGWLSRDFTREHDDVTVVAVRSTLTDDAGA